MNRIAFLAAGVASGDRARARMRRHGCTPNGSPLWSDAELDTLRRLHPDYQAAIRALGGKRSYSSVRAKAQQLGLAPKRQHWTGEQVSRLRKVYRHGTLAEVQGTFPNRSLRYIRSMAGYFGFTRPRPSFVPTGYLVIDQIRERCFDLHLSMGDLDAMAGTGTYFAKAGWHGAGLNPKAVARAIKALDGELSARWNDTDEPASGQLVVLPKRQQQLLAA